MPTFPSQEWADAFRQALSANAAYREAARAWEGDLFLVVSPDEQSPNGAGVLLDLYHGECRSARFLADAASTSAEFVYSGTRANWGRLLKHEIDPIRAILDGTFKIRGNLAKAARFTRAAAELVSTAAQIPTSV